MKDQVLSPPAKLRMPGFSGHHVQHGRLHTFKYTLYPRGDLGGPAWETFLPHYAGTNKGSHNF